MLKWDVVKKKSHNKMIDDYWITFLMTIRCFILFISLVAEKDFFSLFYMTKLILTLVIMTVALTSYILFQPFLKY